MQQFDPSILKTLYTPPANSHKGQNGKLLVIGGSHLFHAASLWALEIASKIVDMVFYSSVPENNQIVFQAKSEFRNGIVVPRDDIENYINQSDAILLGPGMMRAEKQPQDKAYSSVKSINQIKDEGLQAHFLTQFLLNKYSGKKWIIDAGALQMLDLSWLIPLQGQCILTPHPIEFQRVFHLDPKPENVSKMAKTHNCIIVLKGLEDTVCSPSLCVSISGGNAGMTKGGTGDVLGGLIAALACKNDLFLAAIAGCYINKKAGESLFANVGYYFNSTDLINEIPKVMKKLIL